MEYFILQEFTLLDLMRSVNYLISQKWTPLGAPFQIVYREINPKTMAMSENAFCQAMTRAKPNG